MEEINKSVIDELDNEPKEIELKLVVFPNPFLRFKTVPFTAEQIKSPLVKQVTDKMIEAMYTMQGVGLAANQVGIPNSIFVTDYQYHRTGTREPKVFLNPKIVEINTERGIEIPHPGEGCLSLPYGYRQPIPRPWRVQLNWTDLSGEEHTEWFAGIEAIVIQHELDHLDGHLFVDRMSKLKQDMFKRRVQKVRRQYKKGYKTALNALKNAPKTKEFAWKKLEKTEKAEKE